MANFPTWISLTSKADIHQLAFGPTQFTEIADLVVRIQPFSFISEPGLTEIEGSGEDFRIRTIREIAADRGVEILIGEDDNVVIATADLVPLFRDVNHYQIDVMGLERLPAGVSELWMAVAGHVWEDGPILGSQRNSNVFLSSHDDLYGLAEVRSLDDGVYPWMSRLLWLAIGTMASKASVGSQPSEPDESTVRSVMGGEKCFLASLDAAECAGTAFKLPFSRTEWNPRLSVPSPTHVITGDFESSTWHVDEV